MESCYLRIPFIASVSGPVSCSRQEVPSLPSSATDQHLLLRSNSSSLRCFSVETIFPKVLAIPSERRWENLMHNRHRFSEESVLTALGCKPSKFSSGDRSSKIQQHLSVRNSTEELRKKGHLSPQRTLFLVDVHPLCYEGKKPRPTSLLNWMKLLFDQVSLGDPVIAVMDGERGNDYRKGLLPSYKENRTKYKPLSGIRGPYFKGDEMDLREAFLYIKAFLQECHVPVLKVDDAEADDVIATLMQQAVDKGMRVVVASPDMDYRQLLAHNVNMVLPLPEFGRWSFYTLQQYIAEHDCDPSSDLGLRCMLGDQSDNVPGLPEWAPGFGRKTALKLMKKHGSLENLLLASKTRTVGKPYIQEALAQHRDALYRNLQVLSLRRDLDITLKDSWCIPRDRSNETQAFTRLREDLQNRRYHVSH